MDHLQVAAVLLAERLLLEQELRQAGDRGERVVELVGDARHQVADRRELLALDELRLEGVLFGDVLDEHHQAAVGLRVGHAGGGDAHRALQRRRARHERRRPLAAPGRVEQLHQGVRLAEQRLAQVLARHGLDRPPQQGGQRPVGPPHAALLVHDRHALAQRVERRLPLFLGLPHEVEEPGVGEHDGGVRGERGQQPDVLGRETAAARIGDEQRPHRHAVGIQGDGGGGVGLDLRDEAGGPAPGMVDQLELLSGQ